MTQRPDLMKVALPAVGVMDMLRYHTFTAGAGWAYDYGTSEDSKEMFEYDALTCPMNIVGNCAVSIPAGKINGIPVGMQIACDKWEDELMLRIARGIEKIREWREQRPIVKAKPEFRLSNVTQLWLRMFEQSHI